jgi:hypothetical protein
MPPSIRPLDDSLVLAGFARTGVYREVYRVVPDANPYEPEIARRRPARGRRRRIRLRGLDAHCAMG